MDQWLAGVADDGPGAFDAVWALTGALAPDGTATAGLAPVAPRLAELAAGELRTRAELILLLASAHDQAPEEAQAAVRAVAPAVLASLEPVTDERVVSAGVGLAAVVGPAAEGAEAWLERWVRRGPPFLGAGALLATCRVLEIDASTEVLGLLADADEDLAARLAELGAADGRAVDAWVVPALLRELGQRLVEAHSPADTVTSPDQRQPS